MSAQETVKRIRINLNVNGSDYFVDLEKGYELLSEVLRERLGLLVQSEVATLEDVVAAV